MLVESEMKYDLTTGRHNLRRSRTKKDLTTGQHNLRRSRTTPSPVQQDQVLSPQKLKFPDMPQLRGGGCTLQDYLQRLLFPGRQEKLQVRPSTGMERTCCVLERKENLNIACLPASTGTVR